MTEPLLTKRPMTRRRPRTERVRDEFDQKVIDVRRVARVVAGGRRFSFSAALVVGDRKGRVGVGLGKASDTMLAIQKAVRDAKKRMITVPLTDGASISHPVRAKFCASYVMVRPTEKGLIAGSSVRNVLELAGIRSANAKILSRSKNKLNNARAAVKALSTLS